MSAKIPEAYWGEWYGKSGFMCGLCGQIVAAPEVGDNLADIIALGPRPPTERGLLVSVTTLRTQSAPAIP